MASPGPSAGGARRASATFGTGADPLDGSRPLLRPAKATLVVSVDVGTYGSGFAYSAAYTGNSTSAALGGAPGLQQHTEWPDRPAMQQAAAVGAPAPAPYPKTRSALLLKGGRGVAFGWSAEKQFLEMGEEERRDGRFALVYGTAFKLGLMDPARAEEGGLPAGVTAEAAFGEFLRLLKVYIMQHLRDSLPGPWTARGMVRWCLTVPAIWTDPAKAAVRRAAQRAGLIVQLDSDELTVVLEPEAAALHVSIGPDRPRLYAASTSADGAAAAADAADCMRPGQVFAVVDAGGGTVDITVHEVELRGGVAVLSEAQAVPGEGAMCGATMVDQAFEKHYRTKVGEATFDEWKAAHPREWHGILTSHWEPIKCQFAGPEEPARPDLAPAGAAEGGGGGGGARDGGSDDDEDADGWLGASMQAAAAGGDGAARRRFRVPIPPTLHSQLASDAKVHLMVYQGLTDSIILDSRNLTDFFREAVDGVVAAAQRQLAALAAAPQAPASRCNRVLLVGGFGCSPHLQSRLAAALGGLLSQGGGVLVPEFPASAVLQGAALYGLRPDLIHARASRLTYGVRTAVPYEDGMPSKFWHPTELCYYSAAGFSPFVRRGQLVAAKDVITHVFTPLSADQQIAAVELWATDSSDVRWLEEVEAADARAGGGGAGAMHLVGELQVFLQHVDSGAAGASTSTGLGGVSDEEERDGERLIEVSLAFGRTEIKVTASDLCTGLNYSTRVKFAFC